MEQGYASPAAEGERTIIARVDSASDELHSILALFESNAEAYLTPQMDAPEAIASMPNTPADGVVRRLEGAVSRVRETLLARFHA